MGCSGRQGSGGEHHQADGENGRQTVSWKRDAHRLAAAARHPRLRDLPSAICNSGDEKSSFAKPMEDFLRLKTSRSLGFQAKDGGLPRWLPRALRFKRPLHHCNACSPIVKRRRTQPFQNSQHTRTICLDGCHLTQALTHEKGRGGISRRGKSKERDILCRGGSGMKKRSKRPGYLLGEISDDVEVVLPSQFLAAERCAPGSPVGGGA